jgi:hypothetical protein
VPSRRACTSWLGRVVFTKTIWFSNCTSTPWTPGRREREGGSRRLALCAVLAVGKRETTVPQPTFLWPVTLGVCFLSPRHYL